MSNQTADDWQAQLDGTGEVTIATSRLRAVPIVLAGIAFLALGVFLLVDGTELDAISYDASDRGMAGNDVLYVADTIDADLAELDPWLNRVWLRHHWGV